MTEPVHIRLLGDFSVTIGDRRITASDFERRSGANLVQLLALAPNRRLHREKVIDALWADAPLSSATNQFHKAASFARAGLGDRKAIVVRDEQVHLFLHADDVAIDIEAVTTAVADDQASVDGALAAYRGELLPDLPYDEWVIESREAIRQTLLRLLAGAGRWESLVAIDPLDERANVELMRADIHRGDRTAALRRFDDLSRRLDSELGLEPGPDAVEVRNQAMHGAMVEPPSFGQAFSRLPRTVGRADEVDRALAALEGSRLVTLVGPGGIGKTHLATVVGDKFGRNGDAPDGLAICRFGRVDDEAGVFQETLTALGARRQTDTTVLESVVRATADRSILLVIDNCEHVIPGVQRLLGAVLARSPSIRILATSRTSLGLDGEQVLRLERMSREDAVSLFVAEAARHDVAVDADDELIAEICARVDDLPLAVRLVAARTRSLDLVTLAQAMTEGLDLIDTEVLPGGDYERTLRETVDWSIDSLDPIMQQTIVGLGVFADRFELDGVRAVLDADLSQVDMLRRIDELVSRSLLTVERGAGAGRSSFRLLESIRHVVRERGIPTDVRLRHLTYCRAEARAADELLSVDSENALGRFAQLWSDLRAAVLSAQDLARLDDARAIIAACSTYANLVLQFEVIDWCEDLMTADEPVVDVDHAVAMATWSSLITLRNEVVEAKAITSRAAESFPEHPSVLYARAWIPWSDGEVTEADALLTTLIEAADAPPAIEVGAMTLRTILLWATGQDVEPVALRVKAMAAGRGPLFEAQALITDAIAKIWTDPASAFDTLDRCLVITDGYQLMTLGAVVRATRGVAAGISAPLPDALGAIKANLEWSQGHGFWSYVMAGLGTAAMTMDRAERPDLAVTIISARQANGFVAGFNVEFINDVVRRAREEHPDQFDLWWDTGQRLDMKGTADFGLAAVEELLAETKY